VLVGRPNVGKSTLFNRITGSRRAIVAPLAGTTRDSLSRPASWRDTSFQLFDTGGLYGASQDPLHELVVIQGQRAIVGADLIVFVTDGREGLVGGDETIAKELRETGKPILLAVNKADDKRARGAVAAIVEKLGTRGQRAEGRGQGEDAGDEEFDLDADDRAPATDETTIAIVGRPNVGKSSLVNRLLHEERVMVSDTPGTTRDAIDSPLVWNRRRFRIVDTAGMRRPGRVASGGLVEIVSVAGAKEAIGDADVVALIIDANTGATEQDAAIGGQADKAGRGIVIIANKWDLVKDRGPKYYQEFDEETRHRMRFLDYAPILHISAKTGERAPKILETIDKIGETRRKRVPTPKLNQFLIEATAANPPISPGSKHVRIMYAAQIGVAPPSFVFFTNVATTFHFSYERFLVNKLREEFGFFGTPIRVQVRRRAPKRKGDRTAGKTARNRKEE